MNRIQAKELLPIIKAFAEGRPIEYQDSYEKWIESDIMAFDLSPENYRIKREPKYRPFKDAEECWQEMQKHQPFGWVKTDEGYEQIWQFQCNIDNLHIRRRHTFRHKREIIYENN